MKVNPEQVEKLRNATVAYEGKLLQDYLLLYSNTEESNYTLLLNELEKTVDKINEIRPSRSFLARNPEINYLLNQLKACIQIRAEQYKEAAKTLRQTVYTKYNNKEGTYEGKSWPHADFRNISHQEKERFYRALRGHGRLIPYQWILRYRWNPNRFWYLYLYQPLKKAVEKGEQAPHPYIQHSCAKIHDYCSGIAQKFKSMNPYKYEQQSIEGLIEFVTHQKPIDLEDVVFNK